MSFSNTIYNAVFRRNYVFVGAVFTSAFAFEMFFDTTADKVWDNMNKGRQWKDIRHRYVTDEE
ncbi:cytochrome b-c1 complex subunit 9 [Pyronema omphalodes]|nr:cytochrome b-c1 complex subunit 9 [Pyronema omphalodes]